MSYTDEKKLLRCPDLQDSQQGPWNHLGKGKTQETQGNGQQVYTLIKLSNFNFHTRCYKGRQAGVGRDEGGKSLYLGNNLRGLASFLRNSFSELSLRISGKIWQVQ